LFKLTKSFQNLKHIKVHIVFLLLLNVFYSYTQDRKILQVKGIITNQKDEILSFAFIYDKLGQKGYLSNENGEFNIFVERGTELVFSYLGHKRYSYTIPAIGNTNIIFLKIKLVSDTIILNEITIFPWKTYQQFIQAFLNTHIPDDDLSRAERNIEIMKNQMYLLETDERFQSSSIAYKISQNQMASALYWKGQTQPLQIFNVMAWQEFVRYLREGKFKNNRKQKNKEN